MPSSQWNDIVSKARALDERFRAEGSIAWYRGHRDAAWELKSTLHRYVDRLLDGMKEPWTEKEKVALLRDDYKTLYRKFRIEAWPLMPANERSDWGVVFAMQHYSIPTRLMDWSESFACAVFFAQLKRRPADAAAVWVVDPQALNKISLGNPGLVALDESADKAAVVDARDWHPKWRVPDRELPTIAVAPIFTNPRMVPQRSRFTLAADSFLTLDEQWKGQLVRGGHLIKIELTPETFEDAEEFLSIAGLDAFSFYPDFPGLALKHASEVERTIRLARKAYPGSFK
jgi:hypothetical protein